MRAAEAVKQPGTTELTEAVARYYFKLLAIKDEYEVARLYAETISCKRVAAQFEGDYKLTVPPRAADARTSRDGEHRRSEEIDVRPVDAAGVSRAGEVAAFARHARSTCSAGRGAAAGARADRRVRNARRRIARAARAANYELAVSLASIPEYIRGYGHVKERHLKDAKAREAALLDRFRGAPQATPATPVAVAAD